MISDESDDEKYILAGSVRRQTSFMVSKDLKNANDLKLEKRVPLVYEKGLLQKGPFVVPFGLIETSLKATDYRKNHLIDKGRRIKKRTRTNKV